MKWRNIPIILLVLCVIANILSFCVSQKYGWYGWQLVVFVISTIGLIIFIWEIKDWRYKNKNEKEGD